MVRAIPVRTLVAVAAGGMLGTLMRLAMAELPLPSAAGTLIANLTGAALLGFLVGWAPFTPRTSGPSTGHAFFGTGLLGAFTTYSALALDVATLPGWAGAGYAILTLTGGVGIAAVAIRWGRALRSGRGQGT